MTRAVNAFGHGNSQRLFIRVGDGLRQWLSPGIRSMASTVLSGRSGDVSTSDLPDRQWSLALFIRASTGRGT
jgi:hypothetical protein